MSLKALGAAERRLQQLIAVTRIGRLTGLDRAGIEVACAVRPTGHILQVSNGKGASFAEAARSALFEATELWAAETLEPTRLLFASSRELRNAVKGEVWGALGLGSAGALVASDLWSDRTRISWCHGTDLISGNDIWLPAQAVYCPPCGAALLGPSVIAWTSNGMGAHWQLEEARAHALLEAVERDQLARSVPRGWTRRILISRMLSQSSLEKAAPELAFELARLSERGFDAWLFDLSWKGPGAIGLPLAGALLVDRELGPVSLTAGYACKLSPQEALWGALREAAQSRLTDIHGAREDVAPSPPSQAKLVSKVCGSVRGGRSLEQMPQPSWGRNRLEAVLKALQLAGIRRAATVDVSPGESPVKVVKMVVPQFQVSGLL